MVVVLSGSMEPGITRGDMLFLTRAAAPSALDLGDVVVFTLDHQEIPVVHRVMELHERASSTTAPNLVVTPSSRWPYLNWPWSGRDDVPFEILTKGDNNRADDRTGMIYPRGQPFLTGRHVLGRVRALIPYGGRLTIAMNDYPGLKVVLILVMGLVTLMVE